MFRRVLFLHKKCVQPSRNCSKDHREFFVFFRRDSTVQWSVYKVGVHITTKSQNKQNNNRKLPAPNG